MIQNKGEEKYNKYYYKKSNGKVVELEQQILYIYSKNIIELIIPDGCEWVLCWDNQLKELIIPDGCKRVYCHNNQLKELIIPNGCVWADMKSVTELNKVNRLYLWI